ncbi:MAG: YidB family protein [Acidithiobacillus sp.]|nr:YidB family protein [Acidithiobacillus sp.]
MSLFDKWHPVAWQPLVLTQGGFLGSAVRFLPSQPGGVSGTLQQLHDNGLGSVVDSWMFNGQNQPISVDQIESAIGSDRIQNIASAIGVDPQTLTQGLSRALPGIIDRLTPEGEAPVAGGLDQALLYANQRRTPC